MKHMALKMRVFFILLTTILYHSDITLGQVNRKWLQIDNRLFRVDPVGRYSWEMAVKECKEEHMHLIRPETNYDYTQLKGAIIRNFHNYSAFWTSGKVKYTSTLDSLGLGRSKANQKKCNKFDNATLFKYQPDDCYKLYGFICERSLLNGSSQFKDKLNEYHIQPLKQFNCLESYNECSKRDMSLTPFEDYHNRKMLQEYIFINYGERQQFWLDNCTMMDQNNQNGNHQTKLGFICERTILQPKLTTRHLILIVFLSLTIIGAIFVYIIGRCCCPEKEKSYRMEIENYKNFKDTEMK